MTIIKQDSTGLIAGANSYASVADLEAYATDRDIELPDVNKKKQTLLIKAMDYFQTLEFKNTALTDTQQTAFPRTEIGLPNKIVKAQLILATKAIDTDLLPTVKANAKGPVTEERVEGAVTVKYAQSKQANDKPQFSEVDALLKPYLKTETSGFGNIKVGRA